MSLQSRVGWFGMLVSVVMFCGEPVYGAEPSTKPSSGGSVSPKIEYQVEEISNEERPKEKVARVGLGESIRVKISHFSSFVNEFGPKNPKLILTLNGWVICAKRFSELRYDSRYLYFLIERTESNKEAWASLLGSRSTILPHFQQAMEPGLRLEGGAVLPVAAGADKVVVVLMMMHRVWIWLLFFVGVLLALILFSRRSNLLRVWGVAVPEGSQRPYSLGLVQMAFWFFLISSAFLALWLVTGSLSTISTSMLALMGISSGTALGSSLVVQAKSKAMENQRAELTAEKETLGQSIGELESQNKEKALDGVGVAELASKKARLAEVVVALDRISKKPETAGSKGFLLDLLSAEHGVSFHRFQMAVWTILLGVVFVISVFDTLSMPQFSDTLLGLMGISSGTYLGFKIPAEQKSSTV